MTAFDHLISADDHVTIGNSIKTAQDEMLFQQVQNSPDPRLLCHRIYDTHTQLQMRQPLPNKTEFGPDVFAAWEVAR